MNTFTEQIEQDNIDEEMYDNVVNFLIDLDVEGLSEDRQDQYYDIMEDLFDGEDREDDDDEDDEDDEEEEGEVPTEDEDPKKIKEAFARKKKRISPAEKAKRKRSYRKNKAKAKISGKKRRKTASFKRYKKKANRMSKQGKTSTGKRQVRFV